jgi:hypothetical protein
VEDAGACDPEGRITESRSINDGDGQVSAFESFMDYVAFPENHLFKPTSDQSSLAKTEEVTETSDTEHSANDEDKPEGSEGSASQDDFGNDEGVTERSASVEDKPSGNDEGVTAQMEEASNVDTAPNSRSQVSWFKGEDNEKIVATIHKKTKEEPLGIYIKKLISKDGLYISNMQENSKFAKTNLKVGMKILTIDETPCPETVKEFKALVAEMDGEVTIVAELEKVEGEERVAASIYKETKTEMEEASNVDTAPNSKSWFSWFKREDNEKIVATIHKKTKEDPLGIYIKKLILKDGLYISNMLENSKFAKTNLKVGMKILTINETPCPLKVKEFKALVAEMDGKVTIVAEPEEVEGEERVVVSIYKETKTEPIGIYLKKRILKEGLLISKIKEDSKFGNTDLKVGMKIVKINDQPCPQTVLEFKTLLAEIDGEVTIAAESGKMRITPEPPSEAAVPETSARTSKKVSFADEASEGANAKEVEDPAEAENDILQESVSEKTDNLYTPKIFICNGEERKEVVCTISKRKTESLGLLLREFKGEEGIHVLQVNQRSKLASTALQPGMTILRINGMECPKGVDECIKMLRSITGPLQIVASELVEE